MVESLQSRPAAETCVNDEVATAKTGGDRWEIAPRQSTTKAAKEIGMGNSLCPVVPFVVQGCYINAKTLYPQR
jgi:hypothetical protein